MARSGQRDGKHRFRKPVMDREDVALLACRLLVAAYERARLHGRRIDWDDMEAAYAAARAALDLGC
jgi:hypothetical protein